MPVGTLIKIRRGTRAQLNTAASANLLTQGEPYIITDENRLAVGTAVNAFQAFYKSGVDDTANFVFPGRLATSLSSLGITDWNTATSNGWYNGNSAANAPGSGWYFGMVIVHIPALWLQQTVYQFTGPSAAATVAYRRYCLNGTWSAWWPLHDQEADLDNRYLNRLTDSGLAAGVFNTTYVGDGSKSGGATYQPTYAGGNMRLVQNGGAFTFAADADTSVKSYTLTVLIQNSATAGAITFSGWSTTPKGDTVLTTNGALYMCYIIKHGSIKTINIQAL